MKKLLQKLRAKSYHVRMTISIVAALVTTIIIAAVWLTFISINGAQPSETKEAPSPFDALVGSVKGTFQESKDDQSNTQIINVNDVTTPDQSSTSTQ